MGNHWIKCTRGDTRLILQASSLSGANVWEEGAGPRARDRCVVIGLLNDKKPVFIT
jgi:hypothetical protein